MSRKIYNFDNDLIDVEVIRYFKNNDNDYLIYSLNENDAAGYTKLYIAKKNSNHLTMVDDIDGEWNLIREIIKEIIRNNRDGIELNIIDLDENVLENLVLKDSRAFTLQGNLVNLLQENKNVQESIIIDDLIDEINEVDDKNYKELYELEKEKNISLSDKINSLEEKLKEIKNIVA